MIGSSSIHRADAKPPKSPRDGERQVPDILPASRRNARAPKSSPRRVFSLRLLVPLLAGGLVTLAVLGAAQISERNSRAILMRELETRLLLEARTLANTGSGALLGDFPELTLHPIVREIIAERPELEFAAVVDRHGVIQGHADARALGTRFTPPGDLVNAPASVALQRGELLRQNGKLLVVMSPIHPPSGGTLGAVWVGMKRAYLEHAINDSRRQQSVLLLVLLLAGAISAFVLMTVLLRPIGGLLQGLERIGRGDLDTPLVTRDRTELGVLADAVNRMSAQLKVAQREIVEKERLAREVELARAIQRSLLPQSKIETGRFVLDGSQHAAAEVGGDYYDILPLEGGNIGIAIADVAGKGLGGCLVMSMLSALLRALRGAHSSPSLLLTALEENLVHSLPRGGFVTMFYGVLDPATGRLTYTSAGHTPILVWRAAERRVEWCYGHGVPLGLVRGAKRRVLRDETIDVAPGDLLVHFTDGYSEAMRDGDGEQFGFPRMAEVVERHATAGPRAVIEALERAVRDWAGASPPIDDETLLVLGPAPAAETAAGAATTPRPEVSAAGTGANGSTPADPLALLARARRSGYQLTLRAELEQLAGIRGWIESCPDLRDLDSRAARQLESALYELCANVVEHGYRQDRGRTFELWWVPAQERSESTGVASTDARRHVSGGCFLLQDRGTPFKPSDDRLLDFADPRVRRKGRGIGLDMMRRILTSIDYHPGTAEGNLTRIVFDPASAGYPTEALT